MRISDWSSDVCSSDLLAVPFALGARRARQSAGIAFGLVILVAYNEALTIGKSLASLERISPLIGQWLPLLALAAGSLYLFYRSAYRVPRGGRGLASPLALLDDLLPSLRGGGRLRRQQSDSPMPVLASYLPRLLLARFSLLLPGLGRLPP